MRRCASDAQKLEQLRRLIREIEYLKYTLNSTLYWDKMTYMPEKGLTYRSEVMSFLGAQLYERFRSPELRSLVDHFSPAEGRSTPSFRNGSKGREQLHLYQ